MAGRVTVYGPNILRAPLCDDPSASMIVIRDVSDAPIMVLVRLNGDTWGLSTPDDKDWDVVCIRYGIAKPRPVAEVLAASH